MLPTLHADSVAGLIGWIPGEDVESIRFRAGAQQAPAAVEDVEIVSSTSYVNAEGELVVVTIVGNRGTEILTGITLYVSFYDASDVLLATFPVTTMFNKLVRGEWSPVVATYPDASRVSRLELLVGAAAYTESTNYRDLTPSPPEWTLELIDGQPTLLTIAGEVTNTGSQDASYVKAVFSIHADEPPSSILAAEQTYTSPQDIPAGGTASYTLEFSENLGGIAWFSGWVWVAPPTYFLEVSSLYGSPTGERFYEEGSIATVSVEPIVDPGTGTRWVFLRWTGDVESTEPTIEILMDGPKSVTAQWKTQHFVDVNSEHGSPSGEGWYDEGSTATVSVEDMVQIAEGSRALFAGWTGDETSTSPSFSFTVDEPKTLIANWKTQHYLTIEKSHAEGVVDASSGWFDEGTELTVTAEEIVDIVAGQTRLAFAGWSGSVSSSDATITITIDSPKTLAANWKTHHYVTIRSDVGDPRGEGWYDEGSRATVSIGSPVMVGTGTREVFRRWTGDETSTSPSFSFTVDEPKTLIANWKTQHYLTIEKSDPQGVVDESPQWCDEGKTVTIAAEDMVDIVSGQTRLVFTGWSGDLSSSDPSITVTIDSPKTLAANWKTQHYLTIEKSHAEGVVDASSGWFDEGTELTVTAEEIVGVIPDETRLVFTHWTGDVSSSNPAVPVTVDAPKTLVVNWKTQHFLQISTDPPGIEVIEGEGWYDEGATVTTGSASEQTSGDAGVRYIFLTWTLDGVDQAGNPITTSMDSPHHAVAKSKTEYYLTVESEMGSPQGEGWYDGGSVATFSVTSPLGLLIQDVFAGWSGDSTSTSPADTLLMDSPKTVAATWRTDYTQLLIVVGGVAAVAGGGALVIRRRGRAIPEPRLPFCTSCGAQVEPDALFCPSCGTKLEL